MHTGRNSPILLRMYRRFGLIYTIFSLLVLAGLTIFVLARLDSTRTDNLTEMEASFRRLQSDVALAASRDEPISQVLREYTLRVPAVRALVAYDLDRGLRYVWAADTGLLGFSRSELETFRGFPTYRLNDIREARLREQLPRPQNGRLYLDAVYRVLSFSDAYPALRDTLIALLGFAFLTVLVLLALGRIERPATAPETGEPAGQKPHAPRRPGPSTDSSTKPAVDQKQTRRETEHRAEEEKHPPEAAPEDDFEEVAIEELATDPGEPGTLFNPVTGLSYREHLERRLGLELERAAYNDQDLACLLVRFEGVSGGEAYVTRAKQVLATFQFEDLCFEYDDSTFCVILPNTELPQALRQAQAFHTQHRESVIGLSARNGRLVEAHRILTEADRSLRHAEKEPGRIVGFQPDPRKYRQYISQNTYPG